MAFCSQCGGQLVEGAQFCTKCGSQVAAGVATPGPTATRRSPLVWLIPALIAGLVVLGVGGWFAFGLISGGTQASRAKEQAEAVADLIEGYTLDDFEMIRSVLPQELHEVLATEHIGWGDGVSVVREWDGDVLRLTATSEEYGWENVVEISADGGKDRGIVTTIEIVEEGVESEVVVVREDGRWVVVEIDGTPIRDSVGTIDDYQDEEGGGDESSDDDSGTDFDAESQECWGNQEIVVEAANEWYNASADNFYEEIVGDVDFYHLLKQAGYLEITPTCPYDDSSCYLFDDGSTICPSGEHGSYLYQ